MDERRRIFPLLTTTPARGHYTRAERTKTMFDEFKPGDVIAEEKFRVVIPDDGTVIHYAYKLEKSGSFAYGNGTCVTIHNDYNGQRYDVIDTRYCPQCGTVDGFREWAAYHIRKSLRPDCMIERDVPKPTRTRKTTHKEYGVHRKSSDGKAEATGGCYRTAQGAEAFARKCRESGNRDVYIVERDVTEWRRMK